jgi:outer membrane protein
MYLTNDIHTNSSINGETNMTIASTSHKDRPMGQFRTRISVALGGAICVSAAFLMGVSPTVAAQSAGSAEAKTTESSSTSAIKIGFVNTQRILRDSAPAVDAQTKIEAEFNKRNEELQKAIADFRGKVQQFEKDAPVLAESDRNRRQRELGNVDADLQRKQREIQEDFNRRRNEEFAIIIERANAAIVEIAEKEDYDLILQDAVTVSDRVDITDKIIAALEKKK